MVNTINISISINIPSSSNPLDIKTNITLDPPPTVTTTLNATTSVTLEPSSSSPSTNQDPKNPPLFSDPNAKMAAITAILNPASSQENGYFVFYNDASGYVSALVTNKKSSTLQDRKFVQKAPPTVPSGALMNPGALTSAFFNDQVNVYGAIQSVKPPPPGDNQAKEKCGCDSNTPPIICRLSPGFDVLDMTDNFPLTNARAISACATKDGSQGFLFYNSITANNTTAVKYFTLDGDDSSPNGIHVELSPGKNSGISVAYGKLDGEEDVWGCVQTSDNKLVVFGRYFSTTKTLSTVPSPNTPIACLFVGNVLVIYVFGFKGQGDSPDAMPIYRLTLSSVNSKDDMTLIQEAPAPDDASQLGAFVLPGASDDGKGKVRLTYVQKDSGTLIAFTDNLD